MSLELECILREWFANKRKKNQQQQWTNKWKTHLFYKTPIQFILFCAFRWIITVTIADGITTRSIESHQIHTYTHTQSAIGVVKESKEVNHLVQQRTYHISNSITHYNYFTIAWLSHAGHSSCVLNDMYNIYIGTQCSS